MNARVFIACLALLIAAPSYADAIDDYVKAEMQKQHVPGVALAVIRNGKPIKVRGYGVSNVELNTPVTAGTMFKIASLSKEFIATAIMLLVADGKLSLEDSASKFFEDAPAAWRAIKLTHLLSHTSGLAAESPGFDPLRAQSDTEVIRKAYGTPLSAPPGEKAVYSNLGYFVLAEIVHRASGRAWPEFLQQRIFRPLHMTATRTTDLAAIVPNRADGYLYRGGTLINAPPMVALRPSGALLSNLTDFIKWDQALSEASILPQAVLDRMWTPFTLNSGATSGSGGGGFGFGWVSDERDGHRRIRHGGSLPGFRAEYVRFANDRLHVIVLTNGEGAVPEEMAIGVMRLSLPQPARDSAPRA